MLITVDGIDGSGKTTLAQALSRGWEERTERQSIYVPSFSVREYTEAYLELQDACCIKREKSEALYNLSWFGDAIRSIKNTIEPLLAEDIDVFTDRYILSLMVYPIATTSDPLIRDLFHFYAAVPKPEWGYFLDLDVDVALSRICKRGIRRTYYESAPYLTKIRGEYYRQIPTLGYPISVVDAGKSPDKVLGTALDLLMEHFHYSSKK